MKKISALILITVFILAAGIFTAEAKSDPFYGFTGLFELLSKTEVTDYDAAVDANTANEAIKRIFGDAPFKNDEVLNRDLVKYLAEKFPSQKSKPPFRFKDAGLVEKDFRKSYSDLCAKDALYAENGFLKSDAPLTYRYLIGSLSYFEDEILSARSLSAVTGTVISVSLENRVTEITLSNSNGVLNLKCTNLAQKKVYKDGELGLYSHNIKRDEEITVYINSKKEIEYICQRGEFFSQWLNLKDGFSLYKASIYYIDDGTAIVTNASEFNGCAYTLSDEKYTEFFFDGGTVFKYNFSETSPQYINGSLLDRQVYIICDKNKNAKYFNISE